MKNIGKIRLLPMLICHCLNVDRKYHNYYTKKYVNISLQYNIKCAFHANIEGAHKTNNSWIVNDIRCKIIYLKSTEFIMLKFIIAARSF